MQRLIVPVGWSQSSWHAVDTAVSLARRGDAAVHIVQVEFSPRDRSPALAHIRDELARRDLEGLDVSFDVEVTDHDDVAPAIDLLVRRHPESTIVMASHGRGRSAAVVGSVAAGVLDRTFGPVMIVGPRAQVSDFSGPVVVSVDGSHESEAALPLAAAWAIELRTEPWVVHATGENLPPNADVSQSAYPGRLARDLERRSHHRVNFEELHGHPAAAVPEFAHSREASLIVASSHGRTGWSRLTMGSVVSGFVRHASCPVLVFRLPDPSVSERTGERVDAAS